MYALKQMTLSVFSLLMYDTYMIEVKFYKKDALVGIEHLNTTNLSEVSQHFIVTDFDECTITEYLQSGDLNIILVDWSNLSKGPCYPAAVWNSKIVGKCTAQMVKNIIGAGSQNIHIIGFSLGAHVAGFIANNIRPFRIPRITGLDPAMPGFATVDIENKLDANDAKFVDVLHTNAFVQGIAQPIGHVDFYVNGGMVQPGCWAEARFFACNHHRAALYFAESINTKSGFWGWYCSSYLEFMLGHCLPSDPQIIMGEYTKESYRGIYLVITNSVSPFAVGKYLGPVIEIFKKNLENNNL